ncbi:MAG: hypothetical protein GF387_00635 [Candidatus Portnoybacteria bacterium]|nr:hypothetical protein [Candidatus Portnoybacteria bacterium]
MNEKICSHYKKSIKPGQGIEDTTPEWFMLVDAIGLILLSSALILFAIMIIFVPPKWKEITMAIPQEIEKVVEVESIKNIVIETKTITFGGGIGAGIGTAQIQFETAEKFLKELEEGSKIYVSLENHRYYVLKRYLSAPQNQSIVFVYEKKISPPKEYNTARVKHLTQEKAIFSVK